MAGKMDDFDVLVFMKTTFKVKLTVISLDFLSNRIGQKNKMKFKIVISLKLFKKLTFIIKFGYVLLLNNTKTDY